MAQRWALYRICTRKTSVFSGRLVSEPGLFILKNRSPGCHPIRCLQIASLDSKPNRLSTSSRGSKSRPLWKSHSLVSGWEDILSVAERSRISQDRRAEGRRLSHSTASGLHRPAFLKFRSQSKSRSPGDQNFETSDNLPVLRHEGRELENHRTPGHMLTSNACPSLSANEFVNMLL